MGCRAWRSMSTMAPRSTRPTVNEAVVSQSPQPADAARMKPKTRANMRGTRRGRLLRRSSWCPGRLGQVPGARTIAVTPMGTLMNMPQRHESQLVSMPPSTMPMLPAAPLTAP